MLPNPNDELRLIVRKLAEKSDCFIVLNRLAVDILKNDNDLKDTKIVCIPHGIPP